MNYINIAGNLGADPEVRFTSTGKKVTTLRVATRTRGRSKQSAGQNQQGQQGQQGQEQRSNEDTIWWKVTVWGEQFDKMISFLKKGSAVIAIGEIHKPEIFNDREGRPQISLEITAHHLQFSPFGRSSQEGQQQSQGPQANSVAHQVEGAPNPYLANKPAAAPMQAPGGTFDDEVPF